MLFDPDTTLQQECFLARISSNKKNDRNLQNRSIRQKIHFSFSVHMLGVACSVSFTTELTRNVFYDTFLLQYLRERPERYALSCERRALLVLDNFNPIWEEDRE